MPTFKLIIADPKTGKASSVEVKDPQSRALVGVKVGEVVDGATIGVTGKIRITGGSDKAGFPMRGDVLGGVKKYVLLTKGVGFKTAEKGQRKRKLVRGNIITDDLFQINAVAVT